MKRFCMLITGVSLALLGWQAPGFAQVYDQPERFLPSGRDADARIRRCTVVKIRVGVRARTGRTHQARWAAATGEPTRIPRTARDRARTYSDSTWRDNSGQQGSGIYHDTTGRQGSGMWHDSTDRTGQYPNDKSGHRKFGHEPGFIQL